MNEKECLKVGLVGCGEVANWAHLPSFKRLKKAEVVAVCDVEEKEAASTAQRFHISQYYTDFSEMLAREKLDMVEICTPPDTHAAIAISAMEAGCHVLVEKPMAVTAREADEMIRAAKERVVNLGVVHNMLYVPVGLKAINMVSEGVIGQVTGVDVKYSLCQYDKEISERYHWCRRLAGDVFGNKLPHPVYLIKAFLGEMELVSVYAMKLSLHDWIPYDEVRVILKGGRGIGTITSSLNWPKDTAMLDIFGTKMNLHVYFNNAVITRYGHERFGRFSRGMENLSQNWQVSIGTALTAGRIAAGRHHYGHLALIQKFVESISRQTEPPVTAEEGREVTRLCEEIISQLNRSGQKTP